MTSRWADGLDGGADMPPHWAREADGREYCLVCRRERAVEIALEEAEDIGTEARAKLRASTVVKFEIERDPERTEGEIAKAARTSIGAVRKARQQLGLRRAA